MTLLFSLIASLVLLLAAGVGVWLLVRSLLEQARLRRALDVQMLQVLVPKDLKPEEKEEGVGEQIKERIAVAEQFLSTLAYLPTSRWDRFLYGAPSIIFEIVAKNDDTIVFYAGTQRQFVDHLEKQIYAHYPDADVSLAQEFTLFEPDDTIKVATASLQRPTHLPIATYKELENDPMQALTGALAKIQNRDSAVIQYVLQPASAKARRKGAKAAKQAFRGKRSDVAAGGSNMLTKAFKDQDKQKKQQEEFSRLTPRAQQRIELVEAKASQQLFAVTIRAGVSARQPEEVDRIINAMVGAFAQYDLPDLNSLRLKTVKSSPHFLRDLVFRVPRPQSAVVLSTTELASLFHFPLPTTGTPNILWRGSKVAPAPAGLPQEGVRLGTNTYRSVDTPIYLLPEDRRRHLYLIGQTGTGKTTLFLNMIVQDIAAGHGVAVIDPHGDLIEDILRHVPAERAGDVVLFDPKDTERPLGFNILEVKQAGQKDLVVNEVVQILQKLAARLNPESIGPMFEHYLRNSLLALAEDPNSTLIDVPRMFVDTKFRTAILARVTNPTVRQFWDQEFAQSQRGQLSADMLSYVISKLGRFISNETVRNIIGQSHSSFDVRQIMDEKKILLCNLLPA
ncbi:MAG: type IV secretion system DNA-binding domain-containing protein [Candidatus Andersenbacteria bacterium]|nr:type IV secretion system DNA-binding domain-containing protein [Candidatus Andersenbacteria bacterium]